MNPTPTRRGPPISPLALLAAVLWGLVETAALLRARWDEGRHRDA